MIETPYLLAFILTMALATVLTRFGAFLLPKTWTSHPLMRKLRVFLPLGILTLLVLYSLKDLKWFQAPFGLPALAALALTAALHLWKRQALLSIGAGTACYMILNHFIKFPGS